jgi:hypothetical protein
MLNSFGSVAMSICSVVLDRPDQTGLYVAKDLAGGWAYLIADADGDSRFRGHGACAGGLDVALRCAFLSAIGCVPDCDVIQVMVDSRRSHLAMAQIARSDAQAIATIAGRPVVIMTRPLERTQYWVRSAAERAASVALREREREEERSAELAGLGQARAALPTWRNRRGADPVSVAAAAMATHPRVVGPASNGWLDSLKSCVATVTGDLSGIVG